MIQRFFLLQTQRASTWTTKISSFKLVLCRNLAFRCRQAKKQTLVGALEFQLDLARTSQQSIASTNMEQKLLTLELRGHMMASLPWAKTSLPAGKANKLKYYRLSNH